MSASTGASSKQVKSDIEQIEDLSPSGSIDGRITSLNPDSGEETLKTSRPWFARILKQPPPQNFLDDVVQMNNVELDEDQVKKIVRKLDLLIIPALAVCYAFYYIDKTTLSYAAIFNLKEDLHLANEEYSWLSSIFYWGWVAWAFPTNLLMQKFPLAKYLAFNIFMWGVLLICQASARNFTQLAVLRTLSGAFEGTADPAFVLITSTWYTRVEQPVRIGYWYSANGFGIAIGGLLGYGIGQIHGPLKPWQWEFVIIGTLCCLWAIVMFMVIPDAPYNARFFTYEERVVISSRKRNDYVTGSDSRKFKPDQAIEAFKDPKTYLFFLFAFTANVPNGGTSNFGTLIVQGFGFTTLQTALMQIPYGVTIALTIFFAIWLNRVAPKNSRTILMALLTVPAVAGFAMMAFCPPRMKAARLIGYWMTGSVNAVYVLGLSLLSGNVAGQTKKAICNGALFSGMALGNIVGPFMFKASQAPRYQTGIVGCMVFPALEIVVILLLRVVFVTCNRRRDRAEATNPVQYDEALAVTDLTDWQNPTFRYIA